MPGLLPQLKIELMGFVEDEKSFGFGEDLYWN